MPFSGSGAASGAITGATIGSFLPGVGTVIGGGVGAIAGGFFGGGGDDADRSASSARQINDQQIALSREQMAFQERMSSTAHQREVADLRAAGLNPILSATGGSGASTPGGSMAVLQNPDKNLANDRLTSARNVRESAVLKSQLNLLNAQANAANSNAANAQAANPGIAANSALAVTNAGRQTGKAGSVVYWVNQAANSAKNVRGVFAGGGGNKTFNYNTYNQPGYGDDDE